MGARGAEGQHPAGDPSPGQPQLNAGLQDWNLILAVQPAAVNHEDAALAGLPRMLRKRAAIQGSRRVDASEIWPQLEARWLSTKVREKRFDLGLAEPRG